MNVRALCCGLFLLLAALPLGAGERLTMRVSAAAAFAPADLVVWAVIEADPDNRAVGIVADSGDFYRSSEIQLDGDRAPRTSTFEFRSLPPGTYQVQATLIGSGHHTRAYARRQVNVISGNTANLRR